MKMIYHIYTIIVLGMTLGATNTAVADDERAIFRDWLGAVRVDAHKQGVSEKHLRLLDNLTPDMKVRELAARQPEYVKPIWGYLDLMITDQRIALGQAALAAHADFFNTLEVKYGLPRTILTAIWGVETNYGSNKGSFSVLRSLASLGYEGTRAKFGRQQLLAALSILEDGDIPPDEMTGSWAGAMGHTQFIPTTYQAYAADGTGDGKRDIWNEPHDALASAANYLKVSGWKRGLPWGFEVQLPPDFDYAQARIKAPQAISVWRKQGVISRTHELDDRLGDVSIFVPGGARGPAFLVTRNFRALLRYNTAPAYALAVGRLSLRFEGDAPLHKDWAKEDRPLRSEEIADLQKALLRFAYDIGKADGILGRRTRAAVRDYQKKQGLRADGYATPGLLQYIKGH